jgi:hydrogenase maturation protein HypF
VAERRAWVSGDLGDLSQHGDLQRYAAAVGEMCRLAGVRPGIAAHDLHPDYASSRYARKEPFEVRVPVQHHHAHVAACMAEYGLSGRVLGVALDGMGLGDDGTLWGGEFLAADEKAYERMCHLKPYRLPGGDQATRYPERMALSCLVEERVPEGVVERVFPDAGAAGRTIREMVERGIRSPLTSSAGRLFDAASALLGLCRGPVREAEAAIALQKAAESCATDAEYPFDLRPGLLDLGPMLRALAEDAGRGADRAGAARMFHSTLASGVRAVCAGLRDQLGLRRVVLTGGVFQNALLRSMVSAGLRADGFELYVPRRFPPTDAALSLGQAAVAWARAGR